MSYKLSVVVGFFVCVCVCVALSAEDRASLVNALKASFFFVLVRNGFGFGRV